MKRLLFVIIFLLAACGSTPSATATLPPEATASQKPVATTIPSAATPAPVTEITVVDSAGRSVTIPQPVTHVISLAPSTTEIIAALDGLVRISAVDMYSDYPAEVVALPKITNPDMSVNYEQITALAPDVVFAAGITAPDVITAIEKLGIPIVVVGAPTASFASVLKDIALVGKTLQKDAEATKLVDTMQSDWQRLSARVAQITTKPTVFWELDATDATKPYTIGRDSFVAELLQAAGGTNVFADVTDAYPQVSLEQIVVKAPETIILADSLWGVTPTAASARPGWETIPAIRTSRSCA